MIYFIQAEKLRLIKIGFCKSEFHVIERLKELQIGSPDKLNLIGIISPHGTKSFEALLHRQFKHIHSHGEWFFENDKLLSYIVNCRNLPKECNLPINLINLSSNITSIVSNNTSVVKPCKFNHFPLVFPYTI